MHSGAAARVGAFLVTLALACGVAVPAAFATSISAVEPDYARGSVSFAVKADPGVTAATYEIVRAGLPAVQGSATESAPGEFVFEVSVASPTTVVVRAFTGTTEVWSETRALKPADYFSAVPPTLALREYQVVRPSQALRGTCDSRTTSMTVELKRRGGPWVKLWTGAATPDSQGVFALAGVRLPANRSLIRVVASNAFGSVAGPAKYVYNLGEVPEYAELVLIDKSDTRLSVIRNGVVTFTCRCAIGKPWTPTPKGTFRLGKRTRPPNAFWGPWRMRLSRRVVTASGKPKYVSTRIFIHGTSVPSSIGHMASHGCIRLHNNNIRRLSKVIDGYIVVVRD